MKLKQISLFLQNEPGALTGPCRLLAEAGINLITFALADTRQFGILRLIVRDWEAAQRLLEQNGHLAKLTDVVAIEVEDKPGGLVSILTVLEREGINVEYVYAFTLKQGNKGVLVFRFTDPDAAIRQLQAAQIRVLAAEELERRLGS
jgi:hypothetical protein